MEAAKRTDRPIETGELLTALMAAVGRHMDARGRAVVSVNGKPALIIKVNFKTGEVTAESAAADTRDADGIIDYLNAVAGTRFQRTPKNRSHINARLAEGCTPEDCRRVIDSRWAAWRGTGMQEYMRPCTLFNSEKFEGYLSAARAGTVKSSRGSSFMNYAQRSYSAAELAGIAVDLLAEP